MSKIAPPAILDTVGKIQRAIDEDTGGLGIAVTFGDKLIDERLSKLRFLSVGRTGYEKDGNIERKIVLDLPNELFHEMQVEANIEYHQTILGSPRSRNSYYTQQGKNPPIQKLIRRYWGTRNRELKLTTEFRGWGDTTLTVAQAGDHRAIQHLFSQAVKDGNEDQPIYAGPFFDPSTRRSVFVKVTGSIRQEFLGGDYLVFDLTRRSYDLIVGEWKYAARNFLHDYPSAI